MCTVTRIFSVHDKRGEVGARNGAARMIQIAKGKNQSCAARYSAKRRLRTIKAATLYLAGLVAATSIFPMPERIAEILCWVALIASIAGIAAFLLLVAGDRTGSG